MKKPRVAITVGDPAGIGPEIAARAAGDPRVLDVCEPRLYGPPPGDRFEPGVLSGEAGRAAYDTLVRAVEDAQRGVVDAIATAPVNKEAFRLAGLPWSGHRSARAPHRFAARRDDVSFRGVDGRARHRAHSTCRRAAPARAVAQATIALTARAARFGVPMPRIAVAGLNPHAGEHGLFGREEKP